MGDKKRNRELKRNGRNVREGVRLIFAVDGDMEGMSIRDVGKSNRRMKGYECIRNLSCCVIGID